MIISASRRTDIPAFYSDWFINRIRAGWCSVPNPRNYQQLSIVPLTPQEVTTIVFWSKNPEPLIKRLDELDQRGYRYYFQFTLNDYPVELEPALPPINVRVETFKKLSERLGSLRVIWRYDPIIISNQTPMTYHLNKFSQISESLKGYTNRVMVSFVDYYQKTDSRLEELTKCGFEFEKKFEYNPEASILMRKLGEIAKRNGIEIFTCAEEVNFSSVGVMPGRCIDPDLIQKIWSLKVHSRKDTTQRSLCLCTVSKDIGINDTCLHGCTYCYATRKNITAKRRNLEHDPSSPVLWGETRPLTPSDQARLVAARQL